MADGGIGATNAPASLGATIANTSTWFIGLGRIPPSFLLLATLAGLALAAAVLYLIGLIGWALVCAW